ncbi:MAG TPA: hypothetical protein VGY55_03720 [Pirellulales bacterium]|nr:hypothetical protein [Pirellulales bacterium]
MSGSQLRRRWPTGPVIALSLAPFLGWPQTARAVTPDALEVKGLLENAFKFLETANDNRLGAKCLVGFCFIKRGENESHPQVKAAVDACKAAKASNPDGKQVGNDYVYSASLAVVFLCELNASKYQAEISYFLKSLQEMQRSYGGWGYPLDHPQFSKTADTSMTQYGVLACWEARRHGFAVPIESIERVCGWLMRTQDPTGGWAYQGKDPGAQASSGITLVKQGSEVRQGLSAAALGSIFICGDLLGLSTMPKLDEEDVNLPPALRAVQSGAKNEKPLTTQITVRALRATQERGLGWWGVAGHYKIDVPNHPFYYLYALERFRSFQELAMGQHPREPAWYTDGFQYLKKKQKDDGSWSSQGDLTVPDTAFGILFLMRSTKRSIEKTKGYDSGALTGGRGLPRKLIDVHVRDGRIVSQPVAGALPALLEVLSHPGDPDFHDLADDPRNIISQLAEEQGPARDEHLALLRQLATLGPAESRLAAVRVLGKLRDMGSAPTLIAALSDSEWQIVYAADQGLRFTSRRIGLKTVAELPDETARAATIAEWKKWYAAVNPGPGSAP